MRWKLDDLYAFRAIVECSGLTQAARKLEMPKSTISNVLQRLEGDVGFRLVERNARSIGVTPEGQTLYHYACRILDLAEEAESNLGGLRSEPSGRVSLAVPGAFCREFLAPRLPDFAQAYPAVSLDVVVTSHQVDVLGGEFDMAVVVGEQIDSNLAQKRLFAGGLIWISSPGYALRNNLGERLHDHASHLKICETRYAGRQLEVHQAGKAVRLVVPPTVARINDPLSVREAVIAGFGVSLLPLRYCRDQLRSGELVEVWQSTTIDAEASKLSVIFPGRRLLAPRCRAVLNFLEDICRTAAAE